MLVYLFILFLLIILSVRHDVLKIKRGYNFSYILTYIVFVLVAGLRYKVGGDTLNYMEGFDSYNYPTISFILQNGIGAVDSRYDPLWILFGSLCRSISDSFFFMQFMHSLIINAIYFHIIYKYTHNRFFTLLLYFLLGYLYLNTEIMRESMAVAVFLLSLQSYYDSKWVKYYFYAVIATLFHSSALVVFFFPLLKRIKLNKWFFIILISVAILSSYLWYKFMEQIEIFFFLSSVQDKVQNYIGHFDAYQLNMNGVIYGVLSYVVAPLLIVLFSKKYVSRNLPTSSFILIYTLLGLFVVYNNTIFIRLQNYLFFPFLIFFSNTIYYSKKERISNGIINNKIRKLKIIGIFLYLVVLRNYIYFRVDEVGEGDYVYQRYIPYISVFDKKDSPSYRN